MSDFNLVLAILGQAGPQAVAQPAADQTQLAQAISYASVTSYVINHTTD
jgi:hypothetical protein